MTDIPDRDGREVAAQLTVTLYTDGTHGASFGPGPNNTGRLFDVDGRLWQRAIDVIRRVADIDERERLPVHCPQCHVLVEGVIVDPAGENVLRPCAHSFPLVTSSVDD